MDPELSARLDRLERNGTTFTELDGHSRFALVDQTTWILQNSPLNEAIHRN